MGVQRRKEGRSEGRRERGRGIWDRANEGGNQKGGVKEEEGRLKVRRGYKEREKIGGNKTEGDNKER